MSQDDRWTEMKIGPQGVAVTLYEEDEGGVSAVVDETWYTHDELSEIAANGSRTIVLDD